MSPQQQRPSSWTASPNTICWTSAASVDPTYLSVPSAINSDIIVNMEKFIRVIHLWYIYHINILNMNDIIKPGIVC